MAVTTDAIRVEDLKKHYGQTKAVDGITFAVQAGEIFGMLGPNGAGKSTTIEMIEGLRQPDAGGIEVLGLQQPREANAIKERIGTQLQTSEMYPLLSVTEIINLFRTFYRGRPTLPTEHLIHLVGLEEKRDTRSKQLSGGQKQRLSVALALVNDPDLVFLDEPTTGMDPQARRQLWDVVRDMKARGKTVLMTTHYMDEAQELCDRIAIVDHGKILELDTPNALIHKFFHDVAIEFADGATDVATYQAMPGVINADVANGRVTLHSTDVPRTMGALLAREGDGQANFSDLNVRNATLEDVFLKLTGRALRD